MKKKHFICITLLIFLVFLMTGCDPSLGSSDYGLQKDEYLWVSHIQDDIYVIYENSNYYLMKSGNLISEGYTSITPLSSFQGSSPSTGISREKNGFLAQNKEGKYFFINGNGDVDHLDERLVQAEIYSSNGIIFRTANNKRMYVTFDNYLLDFEYDQLNRQVAYENNIRYEMMIGARKDNEQKTVYDLIADTGLRIFSNADFISRLEIYENNVFAVSTRGEIEIYSASGQSLFPHTFSSYNEGWGILELNRSYENNNQVIVQEKTFLNDSFQTIVIPSIENDGSTNLIDRTTMNYVQVENSKDNTQELYFYSGIKKTYHTLTFISQRNVFIFVDKNNKQGVLKYDGEELYSETLDTENPLSILLSASTSDSYNYLIYSPSTSKYVIVNSFGTTKIDYAEGYEFSNLLSNGIVTITRLSDNSNRPLCYSADTIDLNTLDFYSYRELNSSLQYFIALETPSGQNARIILVDLVTEEKQILHQFNSSVENPQLSTSQYSSVNLASTNNRVVNVARFRLNLEDDYQQFFAHRSFDNTLHVTSLGNVLTSQANSNLITYLDNQTSLYSIYSLNDDEILTKRFETPHNVSSVIYLHNKLFYTTTHAFPDGIRIGLLTASGQVAMEPIFNSIVEVKGGKIAVRANSDFFGTMYGIISYDRNDKLKLLVPMNAFTVQLFADGSYMVIDNTFTWNLYNSSGRSILKSIRSIKSIPQSTYYDTHLSNREAYFIIKNNGMGQIFFVDARPLNILD